MKYKHIIAHMEAAKAYARCSTAKRLQVGALIVKNNRPISEGYNGMPSGWDNACEDENNVTKPEVRHAEINAIRALAATHESTMGADLFVTHAPCKQCAIDIIESGIRTVFYEDEYRSAEGIAALRDGGVEVICIKDLDGVWP